MAIINYPENLIPESLRWVQMRYDKEFRSMFGSQIVEGSIPVWQCELEIPNDLEEYAGAWQSLLLSLKGKINQLALHNLARPFPLGTLRGELYLASQANSGDSTISVNCSDGSAGSTLKQGDYIGIGYAYGYPAQVVMVVDDTVVLEDNTISVNFWPPLKVNYTEGTPIHWDKPKVLFRRDSNDYNWNYESVSASNGATLTFTEDYRL